MSTLKHVYLSNSSLFVNNKLVLRGENPIFAKFLKEVYLYNLSRYPKFYKMDALSKLAFVASEVLLKDYKHKHQAEEVGIILQNKSSTIIVDKKHQASISNREEYFPSPANFVYTLPNVMTGEICIRNGFKGENAVFIVPGFDAAFLMNYLQILFDNDKTKMMLGGFVDAGEDYYEAFMFIIDEQNYKEIQADQLYNLYKELKENAETS